MRRLAAGPRSGMPVGGRRRAVYQRGVDVRCPSCGGGYSPAALRLRLGHTRGLAICAACYHTYGPDGRLRPAGEAR